nr:zinc finger protein 845-like isoform X2 [Crassostrea gigas]XP_011445508.1 zinc finger protein 845-like isoform X2 [Crassostrea gigas]XP_011445509.1 zinc finger protein 845-like isoform X2 [Crassostrea gigas]XP_011445511.1 zinc finger protein 845-like isoform X2 [Crassostrea gigas]XP_034301876.1 zinc finger protein 845-like isoform X2 [Crassostrea gigas]XP_034301878.1 zinc finger protein 845-like isoform X2 [Crassostrea gigas]XP_034301879.1 zinc finger protein 845-like isoform X2 [Crassostr|eukprot:XP_011445507.1 PREDICTED: zinc finger protein 845-like isoform X2 [Crassostrea gigas]
MPSVEQSLVERLLKQSILTVCKEAVAYSQRLEIDGIICISPENQDKQIVVKVHELFKKTFDGLERSRLDEHDGDQSSENFVSSLHGKPLNGDRGRKDFVEDSNDVLGENSNKALSKFSDLNSDRNSVYDGNEDSDSSHNEMEIGTEIDEDSSTSNRVIKKQMMSKIMAPKLSNHKKSPRLKQQANSKSSGSVKGDDEDVPGYIYNSEAPKADIKPVKDVECKRCFQVLPDGPSFETHNLNQHNVYTCLVCYNTFTCRNNMKRHMRLHTGYKPYQCTLCSESFTRKDDIKRHLIKHNYNKPFRCNLCNKGYMDRKTIKNHMKKEHGTKLLHCCPTCGESFNDVLKFQKHKKSHPELMVYQCSICNFSGSNPLMYNKHMLVHSQEKTFTCVPCGSEFTDPFKYTGHLKKHRSDGNFDSYQCCFCSHVLPTYDQFIKHEHTHVQSKRHTCTVCMKQFRYPSNLREHMLIHSDMSHKIKVHIKKEIIPSNIKNEVDGDEDMLTSDNKAEPVTIKTEPEMTETEKEQICSQYWCTECQTGFESENDLTDHISFAHDESVMKPDACSGLDNSNDDGTLKYEDSLNDVEEDDDDSSSDNEDENFKVPKKVNNKGLNKDPDNAYSLLPSHLNHLAETSNSRMNSEDEEVGSECSNQSEHNSMGNPKSVSPSFSDTTSPAPNMPVFPMNEQDNHTRMSSSSPSPVTNSTSPNNFSTVTRSPGFERVITPEVLFRTKEPFKCDICRGTFDDFESFDKHCNSIHRRYICDFCGKQFTSKPNRDRHVRYHTGEKPYKCELCGQSFFRGDDLKYHRTTRHSDFFTFNCNKCRMTFAWAKDLEKHLLKCHR